MKKLITFVVCCFFGCLNVSALENDSHIEYQYIDNVYSNRQIGDNFYTGPQGIVYVNGKIAYCLDPSLILKSDTYTSSGDFSLMNINENMLNYLELVSHFGYGYNGRNSSNYYLATQEIIWEYITNGEIYWTNGRGGTVINIDSYKNEIIESVNKYLLKPDIPIYMETYQGEDIVIEDKNEVLKYYSPDLWLATINDNTLTLSAEYKGTTTVKLTKNPLNYESSYIYTCSDSQTLATFGYSNKEKEVITLTYKVKTLSQISIIKKDSIYQKVIKNKTTKIKIYDVSRDKYIEENGSNILSIGETGILNIQTYLEEGKYIIEEIEAPIGYRKLDQEYVFYIHEYDGPLKEVVIYNDPLTYYINIYKKGETFMNLETTENEIKGTYSLGTISNIEYGIYASEDIYDVEGNIIYAKDSLVQNVIIENGYGVALNVPYGKYYVKELKCPDEYILDESTTELILHGDNSEITLEFINNLKKGNLTIQKKDQNGGLKDAEFNLRNKEGFINIGIKSNEDGFITIKDIPYGIYYLQEVKAPDGYILDNEEKRVDLNNTLLNYEFLNQKEIEEETVVPEEPEKEIPDDIEEPKDIEEDVSEEETKDNIEEEPDEKDISNIPTPPEIIVLEKENTNIDKYDDKPIENPNTSVSNNVSFSIQLLSISSILIILNIYKYLRKI